MSAKPELCAYCGLPLGAARLVVTADVTGGPRNGGYHLSPSCYQLAWAVLVSTLARQISSLGAVDAEAGTQLGVTLPATGDPRRGLLWP